MPTKTNPLGVKGAGEAGCVGAMPAVANALVDALSGFGVQHIEMPATPGAHLAGHGAPIAMSRKSLPALDAGGHRFSEKGMR